MGEYRSPKIVPLSQSKDSKKMHPFALFVGIWFGFLLLAIVLFLGKFYQYLISYEAEYQASLPEHVAEKVVTIFEKNDMATLHNMQTEKPEINEFETEENLYHYMTKLVEGKQISFSKAGDYTPDKPAYYITADRYIVAELTLKKSETETRKYELPCWETDTFEFYTDAEHSIRYSCPTTYEVLVNGKTVDNEYCYKNEPGKGQEYFGDAIEVPHTRTYLIKGFYEEPSITATTSDGMSIEPEMDTTLGMYVVPLTVSDEVEAEMIEFMNNAALTYIHYVANDASQAAAANYFLPGTNYLQMVEYGTSRKYYPWHRIQSEETEVVEFAPYDNDHFYCQLDIHQVLLLYGTQETNVDTECRFYCVRTANGFKVCGLEY